MHIALTADPELPVPPRFYGGIERIIDLLVSELVARGHRVTLFAHPESTSAAELVPWPGRSSRSRRDTFRNASLLFRESRRQRFDLIHSFSRIAYLLPVLPSPIPKLMTYQRAITVRPVWLGHHLSGGTLQFTAISRWMMQPVQGIGSWHLVPNGVPIKTFPFVADPGDQSYLMFLGRVEEIKGPHLAIEVARQTGLPLIIAGNIPAEHRSWFDANIAPNLDDQIRYVGPVDDVHKARLLCGARALLMPILWDEPFGIVMAEALACGTPVLGFDRGSVSEVVEHGVSGYVVNTLSDLVSSVQSVSSLSRHACRSRASSFFSSGVIADSYLGIYRDLLAGR